ncbi:MAG: hypothetical protein ACOCRK_02290 [bacterium]
MNIEIDFTDITMVETEGQFDKISDIMKRDNPNSIKWEIRTDATLVSEFGVAEMTLGCFYDRSIYIMRYQPSIGNYYYNPDIRAISQWAKNNGWQTIQPHRDLVDENREFWQHFYSTNVIDSDYLDKKKGKNN